MPGVQSGPPRLISLEIPTKQSRKRPKLSKQNALQASVNHTPGTNPTTTNPLDKLFLPSAAAATTASSPPLPTSIALDRAEQQANAFQRAMLSRRMQEEPPPPTAATVAPQCYRRRISRKRYKLGVRWERSSQGPDQMLCRVFLRGESQRNVAKRQWQEWYMTDLATIRKELLARNLITYGSSAPESYLRAMYLCGRMMGDVRNDNLQMKWHNFSYVDSTIRPENVEGSSRRPGVV